MLTAVDHLTGRFLDSVGALFERNDRTQRIQRWEAIALVLLILLGALVRFWGMGSYGLHKPDEDTTVLPAVHILEDGTPRFPSGMFYARAIVHSYLIAGSVRLFGENEWALRLPSALCGVLLIGLCFLIGRRFLAPVWNLAFVACIALLPGMIADSQEARMYIFLLAGIAAFFVCVLQWERSDRDAHLVGAVAVMGLTLQFHTLGICSALMVLFPGLVRADRRRFYRGLMALAAIVVLYVVINKVTESFYPHIPVDKTKAAPPLGAGPMQVPASVYWLPAILAVLAAVVGAWSSASRVALGWPRVSVMALTIAGFACQAALSYHLALLFLLAAVVLGQRHGAGSRQIGILAVLGSLLAVVQIYLLHHLGAGSLYKILGIMLGWPSIWTYVATAKYSPLAALVLAGGLTAGFWNLARHRRIPDYWLMFVLAAWAPLLALGFMGWYFPPRYTEFALLPMLLCALAVCQGWISRNTAEPARGRAATVIAGVVALAFINPIAASRAVNAGERFPDHRAAAAYVKSMHPGPHDIIMAEEVLMQTYYLGHVDYWLYGGHVAAQFIEQINGEPRDEYTRTRLISTEAELKAVLQQPGRGTVYIIGSGELQEDGRDYIRGPELAQFFRTELPAPVFTARDGLTKVWRIDPPSSAR